MTNLFPPSSPGNAQVPEMRSSIKPETAIVRGTPIDLTMREVLGRWDNEGGAGPDGPHESHGARHASADSDAPL